MITTVSKWGNSLGVRLPAGVAASTGISSGDKVEVTEAADGSIVIRKRGKENAVVGFIVAQTAGIAGKGRDSVYMYPFPWR